MNENKQEGLVNKEESSRRYWEGLELGNEKKLNSLMIFKNRRIQKLFFHYF